MSSGTYARSAVSAAGIEGDSVRAKLVVELVPLGDIVGALSRCHGSHGQDGEDATSKDSHGNLLELRK